MIDYDPQLKRLLLPPEESFFEALIRIGLYIGAVFQITCLLAIVISHGKCSDGINTLKECKGVQCEEGVTLPILSRVSCGPRKGCTCPS